MTAIKTSIVYLRDGRTIDITGLSPLVAIERVQLAGVTSGFDIVRTEHVVEGLDVDGARLVIIQRLRFALEAMVQLQAHYAQLLNMHDGGERRAFKSADEWLARLDEMDAEERRGEP